MGLWVGNEGEQDMVAVIEQKNLPMEEQHHHRFFPLTNDNIYNCELCGIRIALLQIVASTANDQEQFKACGTCLKEYIDQAAAKK